MSDRERHDLTGDLPVGGTGFVRTDFQENPDAVARMASGWFGNSPNSWGIETYITWSSANYEWTYIVRLSLFGPNFRSKCVSGFFVDDYRSDEEVWAAVKVMEDVFHGR